MCTESIPTEIRKLKRGKFGSVTIYMTQESVDKYNALMADGTLPRAGIHADSSEINLSTLVVWAMQIAERDFTLTREEIQRRMYRGELEATDADGVETMRGQG